MKHGSDLFDTLCTLNIRNTGNVIDEVRIKKLIDDVQVSLIPNLLKGATLDVLVYLRIGWGEQAQLCQHGQVVVIAREICEQTLCIVTLKTYSSQCN